MRMPRLSTLPSGFMNCHVVPRGMAPKFCMSDRSKQNYRLQANDMVPLARSSSCRRLGLSQTLVDASFARGGGRIVYPAHHVPSRELAGSCCRFLSLTGHGTMRTRLFRYTFFGAPRFKVMEK